MLIIGLSGNGRKTVVKMAAFIQGIEFFNASD